MLAASNRHNGSTVAHIDGVAQVIDDERDDCTAAATIEHVDTAIRETLDRIQKVLICLVVSINDRLFGVLWKFLVPHNELV